jgi:hypothetical protein
MLKQILRLRNWARLAGLVTIFLSIIVCSFLFAISHPTLSDGDGLTVATWTLALFTFLLFVAAAIQAGLFVWQLDLIRKSLADGKITAVAAKDAAEAAIRQAKIAERALTEVERPWLFFIGAEVDRRKSLSGLVEPNQLFIELHWRSTPATPARLWPPA